MELKYEEIKEDSADIYESLHINAKYPLKDTFYAFLNDYELHENYDITEETSLYVAFCALLIEKEQNFDFLRNKLVNLISNKNLEKVTNDLESDELVRFFADVNTIKKEINIED
jgi:hypothetical protein